VGDFHRLKSAAANESRKNSQSNQVFYALFCSRIFSNNTPLFFFRQVLRTVSRCPPFFHPRKKLAAIKSRFMVGSFVWQHLVFLNQKQKNPAPGPKASMAKKQKPKSPALGEAESVSSRLSVKKTAAPRPATPVPALCDPNHPCPLGAAVFSEPAWAAIARSLKLSGQELQVVRGVFDDHTEGTIAESLKVSPHTIHTHFERLYRKLGVTGRVTLALRVMDEYIALTLAPGTLLPPLCANFAAGRCPLRRK
jgi:DNA-binding CsgD family transcriptional regulator